MDFRQDKRANNSFIDVTPFLDTIFNLLIFFALSLNFISNPGIKVDLPKSAAQEIARKEKDITIVITPQRQVYLNDEEVTTDTLSASLTEIARGNENTQVLIQADQSVPHGLVVTVMDAARSAGLTQLAIITQPKDG